MNPEAERALALAAEHGQPMRWWWLSFVDPALPAGGRFLGVVVVRAPGFATAVQTAHALGINPGGQVRGLVLATDKALPEELHGTLLVDKHAIGVLSAWAQS